MEGRDPQSWTRKEGHGFTRNVDILGNMEGKKGVFSETTVPPRPCLLQRSKKKLQCGVAGAKDLSNVMLRE
jgi:hypothetical protein